MKEDFVKLETMIEKTEPSKKEGLEVKHQTVYLGKQEENDVDCACCRCAGDCGCYKDWCTYVD